MENVYTIRAGHVIRHGSGDGWIRVDGFNGETFDVADVDVEGDTIAQVDRIHPMTMHDMLRCIKAETGRVYDNVNFIDQKYRVKPEYWSLWGSDTDEDNVVTYADVVRFAHDWQKPIYELFDQLEEI